MAYPGEQVERLDLPKVRIARLYKVKQKIFQAIFKHVGQTTDIVIVADIAQRLRPLFKSKVKQAEDGFAVLTPSTDTALAESVAALLLGQVITKELALYTAGRLAGNTEKVAAGIPVERWAGPLLVEEWVAVNVKDIELVRLGRAGKTAGSFTLQVLTGSPAGETITGIFWASMFGSMLRRLKMKTSDASVLTYRHLVHSKFMVQLTTDDPPKIKQYQDTPVLNRLNRMFHKARTTNRECPQKHTFSCTDCYLGYDECSMATHPTTYVLKACPSCRASGWFDPRLLVQKICLDCQVKQKMMSRR
ncbi:MAG: hypothetical protein D0530_10920 [Methylococcales bacterium]|nr:MAG: hypothetical protein D0530_10920 [Methylococcales bacterium]